jgi:hypothetical protein
VLNQHSLSARLKIADKGSRLDENWPHYYMKNITKAGTCSASDALIVSDLADRDQEGSKFNNYNTKRNVVDMG